MQRPALVGAYMRKHHRYTASPSLTSTPLLTAAAVSRAVQPSSCALTAGLGCSRVRAGLKGHARDSLDGTCRSSHACSARLDLMKLRCGRSGPCLSFQAVLGLPQRARLGVQLSAARLRAVHLHGRRPVTMLRLLTLQGLLRHPDPAQAPLGKSRPCTVNTAMPADRRGYSHQSLELLRSFTRPFEDGVHHVCICGSERDVQRTLFAAAA